MSAIYTLQSGARGVTVGLGTALKAGRSRVRCIRNRINKDAFYKKKKSNDVIVIFFYFHNMALGSTQPITEMSTRNFSCWLKNKDVHFGKMWKE